MGVETIESKAKTRKIHYRVGPEFIEGPMGVETIESI